MTPLSALSLALVEHAGVVVDGRADEPAWSDALVIEGFRTFDPLPDGEPLGDTRVRVLADARALYLFFQATDPEPSRVRASPGRRDTREEDDHVTVYVDPQGAGRRAYYFAVNAIGVQSDGIRMANAGTDLSWDARWSAAARRTDDGYTVELAIPWRSIRHPPQVDSLGLLFARQVARTREASSWPVLDPGVQGVLHQEALVSGPGSLPRAAGLDLIPELSYGLTADGAPDRGWRGWDAGLTARWTPSPSASVLATVNPDFSQVESDSYQIDVNRRYAIYYEEKRPFFLEGREWMDHSFGELVYTRSMVSPLYGVRGTAEARDWTLAVLNVLDAQPGGTVSEGGGWSDEDLAGHRSMDTVLRARHRLDEDGYVGFLMSDRTILSSDMASRMGGVDSRVRVSEQLTADASLLGSTTRLADGQDLRGAAGQGRVSYSGEAWSARAWMERIDPGFRAENGFVTDADHQGGGVWAEREFRPGGRFIPSWSITPLDTGALWTTDGRLRWTELHPGVGLRYGNGAWSWAEVQADGELYADRWLSWRRGVLGSGGHWTRWLTMGFFGSLGQGPYYDEADPRIAARTSGTTWIRLRPLAPVSIEGDLTYEGMSESGADLYHGWVARGRVDLYATPTLWARVIGDWSAFDDSRALQCLAAWERSPGQALYLGGGWDLSDAPTGALWQVQGKASWVFGL